MVDFRMLGPLEVVEDGRPVGLGGAKQRSLLAVLLINRREPVATDRLIESLWGDRRPATAAKTVQVYVSHLRKAIGADLLVTRGGGYALDVSAEQVDADRFERLAGEGRQALAAGDAGSAALALREALALWRGRPLDDLAYEEFAQGEIARLEAARLAVVADRIDADLATGDHARAVAELEGLVNKHPTDERFQRQLMLALYRSGRQADALDRYRDGRRALQEELGLEPGPELQELERAILAHDPALAAPRREAAPGRLTARRPAGRGAILIAVGGVAALLAAAVIAAIDSDEGDPEVSREGVVYALDAETGEPTGQALDVGGSPGAVSADESAVWALDADGQTISRADLASGSVSTFAVGATPIDLESGADALWVEVGERLGGGQTTGPVGTTVARIDPATSGVRARVGIPREGVAASPGSDDQIAVEQDAVWAIGPDGAVARIDPRTDRVAGIVRGLEARAIATGDAGTWVLTADGVIARIDPRTDRFVDRARVGASAVASIAIGDGAVWVSAPGDGTVWRVDSATRPAMRTIEVGTGATALSFGGGALWVANPLRGTISRVDVEENAVSTTAELGGAPRAVDVAGGTVWAAVSRGAEEPVAALAGAPGSRVHPSCEPTLFNGEGEPDALIVSDLPLLGGLRLSAQQMAQAVALEMRRRGFRAGDLSVGYQSCDDSVARTGLFDEGKCAANAGAYLSDPRVVGVVGTVNSPCTVAALPVLNGGPELPPAVVSPLNSYIGLTRPAPGSPPGELEKLYPSGERNFARVFPADDHQATALADVVERVGAERVFTLDDGDPLYGGMLADRFAREARARELEVVGSGRWEPLARDYRRLAARVAAADPDAVFLGGTLDSNGAVVLRAVRQRVGAGTAILVPDGFTPTDLVADQAGDAADGVYVSLAGLITEDLPEDGRRFAAELGETLPGVPIEPSAIYAAAATGVLMDAIAGSDGSRPSVVEEVFATDADRTAIGPVRFDENGDLVGAPVTVLRIEPGARELPSFPDAVEEAVVRP